MVLELRYENRHRRGYVSLHHDRGGDNISEIKIITVGLKNLSLRKVDSVVGPVVRFEGPFFLLLLFLLS